MAQASPDPSWDPDRIDELRELPLDPDTDTAEDARHHRGATVREQHRRRWPRIHLGSVVAVAVGAFVGGIARYGAGLLWPVHAGHFPWVIFAVNTGGAFLLAFLLVLVLEVLPPTTYLRPVLGTGFCGAFTTFSSVATAVDQLGAHGKVNLAAGFLVASVLAGLAAASFGMISGRSIAASRENGRD